MNRRTFLTNLSLAAVPGTATPARPLAGPAKQRILAWAHAHSDFAGSGEAIRRRLGQARDAGIQALLPFIHSYPEENQAWYNASLKGFVVTDLLTRLEELGREAGIEIHPILGGMTDIGLTAAARKARSYQSGKPGGSKQDGRFCASQAATRTGPPRIAADILDHHRVAGLHLDYIRYVDTGNGLKWPCRCSACRQTYRMIFGSEDISASELQTPGASYKYLQFRNANIAAEMVQLRDIARQAGVALSLAARADYFGAALVEGQDWADWARRGWLDFLCPMNYTVDRGEHRRLLKLQLALVDGACPVYSGIGRKWSAGELTTAGMIAQAEDALSLGAAGIAVFRFEALDQADFDALRTLSRAIGG
ncbi:MAG: hypothetical protein NTY38_21395 [Acidobacteria bacterium]|nr:hypothetical protein [Acidobacteriota bacterium]